MVDIETIGLILFFSLVGILILIDRKNVKFYYGIIMRRWKFGVDLIDKIVRTHKRGWQKVGDVAVLLGIVAGIVGVGGLTYSIVIRQEAMLVLPAARGYQYPGPVISVPFWYWLITIFIMITVHEGMHAIFARLAKIPIKEAGIITFLVFPIGAFVEPDMKAVKKLQLKEKLRIFAAGSFGNLVAVVLTFLILTGSMYAVEAITENAGIKIGATVPDTYAHATGVKGILYRINDTEVKSINALVDFLREVKVGDELILYTTEGVYRIKTMAHPENESLPYIGIANLTNVYVYKKFFTGHVSETTINLINMWFNLLFWIFLLNLAVATINMLPLRPLDGGLIYEEILKKKFGRRGERILRIIEMAVLGLLLFSIFGVYLIKQLV